MSEALLKDLETYIADIPDFPKQGIVFKDIMPLLNERLGDTIEMMCKLVANTEFDGLAAIESRGFIFGSAIAARLGKSFIPIRKKGKLPPPVLQQDYQLEYGSDTLEMSEKQTIKKVLIIDDVLATGGTYLAAKKLCLKAGLEVQGLLVLINLAQLNTLKQENESIFSLFDY
jgi:adenine phosphoribosyltransferase